MSAARPFRLLSIDGGGIRGLLSAVVLEYVEKISGRRIAELFDMVVGCSVGSFCAGILTHPDGCGQPKYTAGDLRRYLSDPAWTQRIFKPFSLSDLGADEAEVVAELESTLETLGVRAPAGVSPAFLGGGFTSPLLPAYSGESITGVFRELLGEGVFSQALIPTACLAYDIERQQTMMISSWLAGKAQPAFSSYQAVQASAAPQVLLPVAEIQVGNQSFRLVDGGTAASNPVFQACAAALDYSGGCLDDLLCVSLGTGEVVLPAVDPSFPWSAIFPDWGAIPWALNGVIQMLFNGPIRATEQAAQTLLSGVAGGTGCHAYFRLDGPLEGQLQDGTKFAASSDADDIDPKNLQQLVLAGKNVIATQEDTIDELIRELTG